MINITATHPKQYARIERLFPRLNTEAMDHVEAMEAEGYLVSIINLPTHIDTFQTYSAMLLDQLSEMYQDGKEQFN
jgi:hypothetical protein